MFRQVHEAHGVMLSDGGIQTNHAALADPPPRSLSTRWSVALSSRCQSQTGSDRPRAVSQQNQALLVMGNALCLANHLFHVLHSVQFRRIFADGLACSLDPYLAVFDGGFFGVNRPDSSITYLPFSSVSRSMLTSRRRRSMLNGNANKQELPLLLLMSSPEL